MYWVDLGNPAGSAPGYLRPVVVVQNDIFNWSRLNTVVVCALTTNLRRARQPGNVTLQRGEANLAQESVVNVTQLFTVDKGDLGARVGTLSPQRVREIVSGISLVLEPRERLAE